MDRGLKVKKQREEVMPGQKGRGDAKPDREQ